VTHPEASRASGGAAHPAGPPLTRQGRLRRRFAIAARPLTREPLRPLRASCAGRPGPARWARGAIGGGLADMIRASARKRANPTRKRAEAPITAAGHPDDRRSSALTVGRSHAMSVAVSALNRRSWPLVGSAAAPPSRDQRSGAKPRESEGGAELSRCCGGRSRSRPGRDGTERCSVQDRTALDATSAACLRSRHGGQHTTAVATTVMCWPDPSSTLDRHEQHVTATAAAMVYC
jgi:hypothetical protein